MLADLPTRQHEVLDLLRNGSSEKEAARSLHLSINTVKQHVKCLYRRFNVNSRGELIARLFCGDDCMPRSSELR
jgi:DNA-binding NarL/FixJ family response regulator